MARQASKTPSLLLYTRDMSPPACAVRMVGDVLGLHFECKEPDLLNLEHKKPEFKKLNPMGTIPVLKDGDFVLSESHAIMKYLVENYGGEHQKTLYPTDARSRALVDQCMYYDASVMFNRLKVVALPTLLHGLKGPSAQNLVDIEESYSVTEAYLENRKYLAADHLTLADLSLSTTVTALNIILKLDPNRFPRTVDWLKRVSEESCYRKITEPGISLLEKVLIACWEKNKNIASYYVFD